MRVGAVSGVAAVRQTLEQGEAIRVMVNGHIHRVMSIASDRFPISAPLSSDGSLLKPIIGDVTDSICAGHSNKFYRIVRSGLHEDSLAFGDWGHQWNAVSPAGLPLDLDGAEYVMPFNDDKFFSDLEILVTINRPANLYVFYSDSMAPRVAEGTLRRHRGQYWPRRGEVDLSSQIQARRRAVQASTRSAPSGSRRFASLASCRSAPSEDRPSAGYNMYGIAVTLLAPENVGGQLQ